MNRKVFLAWILTFVGGFTDAYTFMLYGNVFVAGQTGNIIFLAVNLINHQWFEGVLKITIILTFLIGMIFSAVWTKLMDKTHYWRVYSLVFELLIMFLIGIIPKAVSVYFKLPLLAFAMALQYCLYDQVNNYSYANVFTTANLKKATLNLTAGILYKKTSQLKSAILYYQLIACFIVGAIFGSFLSHILGIRAIVIPAGCILMAIIYHVKKIRNKESIFNSYRQDRT
ncbi:YoaK family protein [Lacticaseibacillus paracasei]|uniref:YoaK family protein n=1 Tax=Lacticaseibacillus paracasei TaxID=1597 RepID=UPI003395EB52